jgi:esterase/lipase superfamily enzyme
VTDVIKLDDLILASPDLDFEVMLQRFVSEGLHSVARRITLYVSAKDEALGIAEWLLRSDTRMGKVRPEDFDESDRAILESIDIVDIIDCRVKTGSYGHAYFHSSPAVSSDLLLGMIYGFEAGSPQRPLEEVFPGYWVLDEESYPFVDE